MNTIEAGRNGEAAVVAHMVSNGYEIYFPLFGNTSCDLIVVKDGIISRVEIKATSFTPTGTSYEVALRSMRPNRTSTKVLKFDGTKSDILAVYIAPEKRVVLFKSMEFNGRSTMRIKPVSAT